MAYIAIEMVQSDTSPDVTFNVKRGGQIVNLTGCTVKFLIKDTRTKMRTNDGHNTCEIISASEGQCVYSWQTNDLPNASIYECDFRITFSDGKEETKKVSISTDKRV